MARIFIDGFESGDLGLWSGAYSNLASISATVPAGMSGTYTLWCDSYYGLYKMFSASQTEIYMAFKYYPASADYSRALISFRDSAGTQTYALRRNQSSGFVETHVGNAYGSLVSTGTIPLTAGSAYLIEIRYKPLNSGGVLTTKINGVQDINYSGDTTNGLENVKQFILGYDAGGSPESVYSYYDDFVVDDANWIGNTKIQAIVPTGAGATTGWTPSAGNNWDCVNEKPASDADYVVAGVTNSIDTYTMGNLTGAIGSIKSVAVHTRNFKQGNGLLDRGQHIVRPASTDRLAVSKTSMFPISPSIFQSIWELNPEDSQAWEEADVNGMEVGIKAVEA